MQDYRPYHEEKIEEDKSKIQPLATDQKEIGIALDESHSANSLLLQRCEALEKENQNFRTERENDAEKDRLREERAKHREVLLDQAHAINVENLKKVKLLREQTARILAKLNGTPTTTPTAVVIPLATATSTVTAAKQEL